MEIITQLITPSSGDKESLAQIIVNTFKKLGLSLTELRPQDAKSFYERGISLLEEGALAQAQDLLNTAVELQPSHSLAHQALGKLHQNRGEWESSINHYTRSQQIDPQHTQALCHQLSDYAQHLLKEDKPADALCQLRKVLSLAESGIQLGSEFYTLLGDVYEREGSRELALEAFLTAVKTDPECIEARYKSGLIFRSLHQDDLAIEMLKGAIDYDFFHPEIHHVLGLSYLRKGSLFEAIRSLESSLKLKPDPEADWYATLGLALVQAGEMTEAGIYLTKALGRETNCLKAHYGLAQMLTENGEFEIARMRYEYILNHDPSWLAAKAGIGLSHLANKIVKDSGKKYLQQPQIDAAQACFEAVLQQDQTVAEAHLGMGEIYRLGKDVRQSIKSYEKALELNGSLVMAYYKMGKAYATIGQVDQATQNVQKAHQMNPHNCEIETYLGRLQSRQDAIFSNTGIGFLD